MATRQDKKFKKKKAREAANHEQVIRRRNAIRKVAKEERDEFKRFKRIDKLKKEVADMNVWADDVLMNLSENKFNQLEENAKILKALEQEYEEEHQRKSKINKDLEDQGFFSLEEKVNFLHNQLAESQKAAGLPEHEHDCSCCQDNAEVTVIKAGETVEPKPVNECAEVSVVRAS